MNALKDLVVLDLSRFEAGPRSTYLLGQLGAYILKVEKAYTGDDERMFPPMYEKESLAFPTFNLNKNSLGLDLRHPKAKQILFDLLPHADVLVQNFRAGTIEKMGMDWETIHKSNPRLIMVNNSGFGQDGPYRDRPGVDAVAQCECGLSGSHMAAASRPIQMGGYPIDHQTALAMTAAVLAALLQRDRTGEGQYIEVDLFSTGLNLFSQHLAIQMSGLMSASYSTHCPNSYFKDKRGKYIHISCPEGSWDAFKKLVGEPELESAAYDSLDGRIGASGKISAIVAKWSKGFIREELRSMLEPIGVGAGIMKSYDELIDDPYLKETGYFHNVDVSYVGEVPYPGLPFTMSNNEVKYTRAPKIGEQNSEILHKFLNLTDKDIQTLYDEGVLYQGEHACFPPKK